MNPDKTGAHKYYIEQGAATVFVKFVDGDDNYLQNKPKWAHAGEVLVTTEDLQPTTVPSTPTTRRPIENCSREWLGPDTKVVGVAMENKQISGVGASAYVCGQIGMINTGNKFFDTDDGILAGPPPLTGSEALPVEKGVSIYPVDRLLWPCSIDVLASNYRTYGRDAMIEKCLDANEWTLLPALAAAAHLENDADVQFISDRIQERKDLSEWHAKEWEQVRNGTRASFKKKWQNVQINHIIGKALTKARPGSMFAVLLLG